MRKLKGNTLEITKLSTKFLKSTKFLHHKNNRNENFIQCYLYESENSETTKILDWIKENDEEYLRKFIINPAMDASNNLIDQICISAHHTINIPNALKAVTKWLNLNVPKFDKNEILLRTTESGYGNIILELILSREPNDEMIQALIDVMSWMNEIKIDFLDKFMLRQNDESTPTLFHYLSETFEFEIDFFANLITKIIRWIKLNAPNFNLKSVLSKKDINGHTLANKVRRRPLIPPPFLLMVERPNLKVNFRANYLIDEN